MTIHQWKANYVYLLLKRHFLFSSFFFLFWSQAHRLDHSAHYLRLKFLIENKMQHYVPKPEEDIYELVMFMSVVQVHSVGDYF